MEKDDLLEKGTTAPNFTLKSTPDQTVSLSDFSGQAVVLVFYPEDWSPVCGNELALFNEVLPQFEKYHAEVLGISVDSPWSHIAYANEKHIRFPLLSDFEPKGFVSKKYHAYDENTGTSKRALYVIDSGGRVFWDYVSPIGINPGVDGVLTALKDLSQT